MMGTARQIRLLRVIAAIAAAVVFAGCGGRDQESKPAAGGHAHRAPHGGSLVEVGHHEFNLEFMADHENGMLRCFVLDAHAENFVRISQPVIFLQVGHGERVALAAVADRRTGETVGNTSEFSGKLGAFPKGVFDATIPSVSIKGREFTNVRARIKNPNP